MKAIRLGNKVRCMVTGYEGIAVGRVEYLNGCIQIGIKPKMTKEGRNPDTIYVDEGQVKVVGKGIAIKPKSIGGENMEAPTR